METMQHIKSIGMPAESAASAMWQSIRIILGAGLGMFLNIGPVLLFTFGLFIAPISRQTGWSTVSLAAAIGPAMLLTAVLQPAIGFLVDRYGVRRVSLLSLLMFGGSLIALGVLPESERTFAIFLCVATCFGAAQTPLPYSCLVSCWFDKHRGLALGVALAFSGLGVTVWPHVASELIVASDWRDAYAGMGIIVLALGGVAAYLIKDVPRQRLVGVTEAQLPADGMTMRESLRRRTFWLLIGVAFSISAIITGASMHLPSMLVAHGASLRGAASAASIVGVSSIMSRLLIGVALDRIFAPLIAFVVFLAPALGCMLLVDAHAAAIIPAAALLGVGLGAEADVLAYVASRVFGVKCFGAIYGVLMVVFLMGTSAGPALFARALSGHDGYHTALLLSATIGAVAACLMLMVKKRDFRYGLTRP